MARIIRQTTVVRDGMHNSWTDLQYWQGNYWVSYVKGSGHKCMDNDPIVAVSADRHRFREVASLRVPGDNRDLKLFPVNENRMAAYFPSWTEGAPQRKLQQYISFSDNGFDWEKPQPILPPQQHFWRIRSYQGKYYGLLVDVSGSWENGNKPHELKLAVSDDLLEWETLADIGPGCGLNESDIHWWPDGEAWLVSRTANQDDATGSYFACAQPPYTEWETTPMQTMVHSPVFLEHNGELYVAGRSRPEREGDSAYPFSSEPTFPGAGWSTAVWRVQRGDIEPVLRLPATGDCAYPGMEKDPEGRICITYYSQHAYHTGVVPMPSELSGTVEQAADDIYFAEIELD